MKSDPDKDNRTYYRRTADGQRAYLVTRSGVEVLKLDCYDPEVTVNLDHTWNVERELRPLTPIAAAQVAFELDRAVCKAFQLHALARRQWIDMSAEERIDFMNMGPVGERMPVRGPLFKAVMKILSEVSG